MLHNIDVTIDDEKLGLIVRRMDTMADGLIDPKEFVQALRWHPVMYRKPTGLLLKIPMITWLLTAIFMKTHCDLRFYNVWQMKRMRCDAHP